MDVPMTRSRLLVILLTSFLTWPVSAGSLYKFVDSNGAIVFTDVPPPSGAGMVVQIPMGGTTGVAKPAGTPYYDITDADEAMARANARIDVAEHDLAVARQGLSSPHDGLGLVVER